MKWTKRQLCSSEIISNSSINNPETIKLLFRETNFYICLVKILTDTLMNKLRIFGKTGILLAGLAGLFSAASCSGDAVCPDCGTLPTVAMEMEQSDDYSQCRVRFIPSEGTDYFVYCLGHEDDLAAFESGSLEGIESLRTNQEQEVIFEGLEIKKEYMVFARAYNADGEAGGIAMLRFFNGSKLTLAAQYITDSSAGIVISMGDGWSSCRYYMGTEAEREDFVSGKIEGNTISEKDRYVVNRFDLEPSTDYVLYAIPVNRMGVEYEPVEYAFTTYSEGNCAATELEFPVRDVYMVTARLTPNEYCYRVAGAVSLVSSDGTVNSSNYTTMLEASYNGDIEAMLEALSESGRVVTAYNGNPLDVSGSMRSLLQCDREMELYVGLYDENDNFIGAEYYTYTTPSFDASAGEATADVEIVQTINGGSDWGCYHTVKAIITPNEHTLGYFVKMMGTYEYEQAQQEEDPDAYLREQMMNDWSYTTFTYGNYPTALIDEKISHYETENYIVVCPFNANGVDGWGPVTAYYFEIK